MQTQTTLKRLTDLERQSPENELSIEIVYVDPAGNIVERLPPMKVTPGRPFDYWQTVGRIPTHDELAEAAEALRNEPPPTPSVLE